MNNVFHPPTGILRPCERPIRIGPAATREDAHPTATEFRGSTFPAFGFLLLVATWLFAPVANAQVGMQLSPTIPTSTAPPAQPGFGIWLVPSDNDDANGVHANDFIDYYTVQTVGGATQSYTIWTQSNSYTTWSDGRGTLGQGTYDYVVTVFGWDLVPYNHGWIDGYEQEEHDNPEDPNEVTGSHWAPGHYDAGFTWNYTQLGTASIQFSLYPALPIITNGGSASCPTALPFSFSIAATNSPTGFGVTGTLPSGLTFNSGNGAISGVPTQTGTFNLTLSASNATGTATASLALTVSASAAAAIITHPSNQMLGGLGTGALASNGDGNFALKNNGTLWAWGGNFAGALGDGTTTSRTSPVSTLSGVAMVGHSRLYHGVAIKTGGFAVSWGYNNCEQLGDGTTVDRATPVSVNNGTGITAMAGGDYHSIGLKSDGTVWRWPGGVWGGPGVPVNNLNSAVAVSAGSIHNLALQNGTVWAWGSNADGQLGDGTTTDRADPVQVVGLSGVVSIAAGAYHSVAVKSDGTVWAWGYNSFGILGDDGGLSRSTPAQVPGLGNITFVIAGAYHTLALRNDETAWAWGRNMSGALGDGTTTNRATPQQVSSLAGAVSIAAGSFHSLALLGNGTVKAWGHNSSGQLGDGTNTHRYTPVAVINLADVALPASFAPVMFAVTTSGNPTPSYRWQRKPAGQSSFTNLTSNATYLGTDTANLVVQTPTAAMMGDQFRCVVTNQIGTATSNAAGFPPPVAFSEQPVGRWVVAGGTTTFSASASGTPPPIFQWQKNGANIAGATNAALTLSNVQAAAAGAYRVVATNMVGSVSSTAATLAIDVPPAAPSGVDYAERTATTVTLIWLPAIDDIGVAVYNVYRAGTLIGTTGDVVYADSGLTANTAYAYTIKAADTAGQLSAASATLNVTTTQDYSADTDGDGIPNATETALGTNGSSAANRDTTNQTLQNIHRPKQ